MTDIDRKDYMQSAYEKYLNMTAKQLDALVYSKRCGECSKWMTKSCPVERPGTGKMQGYSQGPSSEAYPCKSFEPNQQFKIALECQLMRKLSHDL